MPLTKLQFRPGIVREITSYANEGGWFNCDKIRFRFGTPEKLGGWVKLSSGTYLGSARAIKPFVALDGSLFNGVGTHLKYYVEQGGSYHDITPIRLTTSSGDVTFAASNGSSTLTVSDTDHGAIVNDFVTFSGAASLGGNITAAVLNQEYQIESIVNNNSYTIAAKDTAGTTVNANSSDTGNGGSSVVGAYQINTGLDTTVSGTGWGAGTWGRGTWDSSSSLLVTGQTLRLWDHDNFGEDLIINARDAGIFYWDKSGGLTSRAVALSDRAGADFTTPTIAKQVLVSDRDRHVLVFGCDPENAIGTQDPLLIRFSDQENPLVWQSLATNTAGDLRLGSGSEIVTAIETKQQIIVFTDVSIHAMQFLGPPFTFGVNIVSENITIIGPNAAKSVNDAIYWMGSDDFYVYTGQVQTLPCSVKDYVFSDFNLAQGEKVFAALNSSFSEVWWFYPSSESDEIDRYVVYDFLQQLWFFGTMARTAWVDRGINDFPLAAGTDGILYQHEAGLNDGQNNTGLDSFIESSQIDIGDGENFSFIRRMVPDVTFTGSVSNSPSLNFILQTRNAPGAAYSTTSTNGVTRTATVPVEQFTDLVHVRLRGRSMALKLQSTGEDIQWRLGAPRVDIRPDGRR